jgi:hypothetical protein
MPDTTEPATAPVIDLDRPYLGWFDHYAAGWQAVIVRQVDGRATAYRLGDELSYKRATEMCQVLSDVTGVPVAGELDKRDGFRPISRIEEIPDHG